MGRFPQSLGQKGSKKWIQVLINKRPELLNTEIEQSLRLGPHSPISWLSPREEDQFAEYRDQSFLDKLKIKLPRHSLREFWPRGGPQWDALGRANDLVFLVEAKSHVSELNSSLKAKDPESKAKIIGSLENAKKFFGSPVESDWSSPFYQYTNRLAHLYLLRELNYIQAYLVFIYFIHDSDMNGPKSEAEWASGFGKVHTQLGIEKHKLERLIVNVFIDVNHLIS